MDLSDRFEDARGQDDDSAAIVGEIVGEEEGFSQAMGSTIEGGRDMQETVQASQSGFENLVHKIPGYQGYKDKELRRAADKLLRMELAAKFDDQRKRLTELQHQLISQAQIEFLDDLERAVMKLQLLIDHIKTASYGYAGLFDAVKVKEAQLDALYEFDNQMLSFVDEVASGVDQVSSAIAAREGIGETITDLVSTVAEANMAFGHREEAILQAGTHETY